MAEKCPYCGSTNVSSTGLGYAEKTAEFASTVLVAGLGKIGRALRNSNNPGHPVGWIGKIGGAAVDQICSSAASSITKNVPTQRKCNRCGRTFHSSPDKEWY